MKHLGIVKPDTLVNLLNWVGLPVVVAYFFSMFIFPLFDGGGDWVHVQAVWDRWQSINVGMLAFISSITAFNISRYNANKQRERNFLAAKAFLPAALSELSVYFKSCAAILLQGWEATNNREFNAEAPVLPEDYKKVFEHCIKYAEPDVGDYLSRILVWLQIHDSRLKSYVKGFNEEGRITPDRHNLISYLYRIGELQALINKIFEFARNMGKFDSNPLEWEDFRDAYMNLDISIEDMHISEDMNLEAFTKRAIERNANQNT